MPVGGANFSRVEILSTYGYCGSVLVDGLLFVAFLNNRGYTIMPYTEDASCSIRTRLFVFALGHLTAAWSTGAAHAESVTKCIGPDKKVTYTSQGCPSNAEQTNEKRLAFLQAVVLVAGIGFEPMTFGL